MENKLKHWCAVLAEMIRQPLRRYPVELGLTICGVVLIVLFREEVLPESMLARCVAVPLTLTLAYIVNRLTAGGKAVRRWYYASWLPLVPLWCVRPEWFASVQCLITVLILCPLAVLICRRATENRPFVRDLVGYFKSAIVAWFLAGIVFWLIQIIYHSFVSLFGIDVPEAVSGRIGFYLGVFYLWLGVWLFFGRLDRCLQDESNASHLSETVINRLLSPAILIYTAMLYLYAAKILCEWSLPKGGVAYMVFGFSILAVFVRMLRERVAQQPMKWYFDRMSWISLPVLALFWAGVVRRTHEYGLTDWRVYLIVSGVLMTGCLCSLWSRRWGRYLYVCIAAFLLFGVMAYIPRFSASEIAVRSQNRRVERLLRTTGLLGDDGRLIRTPRTTADSLLKREYRELSEALDYLADHDTLALHRWGIDSMEVYYSLFPPSLIDYVRWGYELDVVEVDNGTYCLGLDYGGYSIENIDGYGRLYGRAGSYGNNSFAFEADTLRVRLVDGREFRLASRDILRHQFDRLFPGMQPTEGDLCDRKKDMLTFRTDSLLILFSSMEFTDDCRELQSAMVEVLLTR